MTEYKKFGRTSKYKAPPLRKDVNFLLKMEIGLRNRIDAQCKRLGCTRSTFARMAIVKLLEEEEFRSNQQ